MLILNCTKAAADFFSVTKQGKKITPLEPAPQQTIAESSNLPDWQWIIHAIKVKSKHVIVAMDYQSRFSITLSGMKKGDDSAYLDNLEHHLGAHIREMMESIGIDPQTIEDSLTRYFESHSKRAIYQRSDRSVQTHINDVVWHFRHSIHEEMSSIPTGIELLGFDTSVNQLFRIRKIDKDYFTPQYEFLHAWLTRYCFYTSEQVDGCIEKYKAKQWAEVNARYMASTHLDANDVINLLNNYGGLNDKNLNIEQSNDNVVSLEAYRKNK